ncbi:MAG TPA: hypothetical protein VIM03_04075 [Thermoleophilaceae bacterium]|jgi:hypothetical protein
MARTLVLVLSLVIICVLGVLTLLTATRQGVDVLVVLSIILLLMMGVGVLGALGGEKPDE